MYVIIIVLMHFTELICGITEVNCSLLENLTFLNGFHGKKSCGLLHLHVVDINSPVILACPYSVHQSGNLLQVSCKLFQVLFLFTDSSHSTPVCTIGLQLVYFYFILFL
jgi:hypothetical protein